MIGSLCPWCGNAHHPNRCPTAYAPAERDPVQRSHPGPCCLDCLADPLYFELWHEGTGCCCRAEIENAGVDVAQGPICDWR